MRAFVGIELDAAWRTALAEAGESIRATDDRWRTDKWVAPENLHVTLKFLGEISQECALTLSADLHEMAGATDPFQLPLADLVKPVPAPKRASMLWCTFLDPDGECDRLASTVERLVTRYGVAVDDRSFTPHVTLVRARRPHPFSATPDAYTDVRSSLLRQGVSSMSVLTATLFRSTLTPSGPRYERLAVVRLGG